MTRSAWLSVALSLGLLWVVLGGTLLWASHRHDAAAEASSGLVRAEVIP